MHRSPCVLDAVEGAAQSQQTFGGDSHIEGMQRPQGRIRNELLVCSNQTANHHIMQSEHLMGVSSPSGISRPSDSTRSPCNSELSIAEGLEVGSYFSDSSSDDSDECEEPHPAGILNGESMQCPSPYADGEEDLTDDEQLSIRERDEQPRQPHQKSHTASFGDDLPIDASTEDDASQCGDMANSTPSTHGATFEAHKHRGLRGMPVQLHQGRLAVVKRSLAGSKVKDSRGKAYSWLRANGLRSFDATTVLERSPLRKSLDRISETELAKMSQESSFSDSSSDENDDDDDYINKENVDHEQSRVAIDPVQVKPRISENSKHSNAPRKRSFQLETVNDRSMAAGQGRKLSLQTHQRVSSAPGSIVYNPRQMAQAYLTKHKHRILNAVGRTRATYSTNPGATTACIDKLHSMSEFLKEDYQAHRREVDCLQTEWQKREVAFKESEAVVNSLRADIAKYAVQNKRLDHALKNARWDVDMVKSGVKVRIATLEANNDQLARALEDAEEAADDCKKELSAVKKRLEIELTRVKPKMVHASVQTDLTRPHACTDGGTNSGIHKAASTREHEAAVSPLELELNDQTVRLDARQDRGGADVAGLRNPQTRDVTGLMQQVTQLREEKTDQAAALDHARVELARAKLSITAMESRLHHRDIATAPSGVLGFSETGATEQKRGTEPKQAIEDDMELKMERVLTAYVAQRSADDELMQAELVRLAGDLEQTRSDLEVAQASRNTAASKLQDLHEKQMMTIEDAVYEALGPYESRIKLLESQLQERSQAFGRRRRRKESTRSCRPLTPHTPVKIAYSSAYENSACYRKQMQAVYGGLMQSKRERRKRRDQDTSAEEQKAQLKQLKAIELENQQRTWEREKEKKLDWLRKL